MEYIINFIRGFMMALADSVPGVSGGTIAFIMGFYDKFINSINDLVVGDKSRKIKALKFLIKLGIGWIVGMLLSISILANLFDKQIYKVSSLFIGFILASLPLIIISEKDNIKGKYKNIIFLIIGALVVVLLSTVKFSVNPSKLNFGMIIYTVIAGALAISAMVLPGISGSTILMSFGLYIPIITGVKKMLELNFSSLPLIIFAGVGVILGVVLAIGQIKKLLQKKRSQVVYMIIGMMIGSFYAIIMGPTTLDIPKDPISLETFSIIWFVVGILFVLGLEKVKSLPFYKEGIKNEKR